MSNIQKSLGNGGFAKTFKDAAIVVIAAKAVETALELATEGIGYLYRYAFGENKTDSSVKTADVS